MQSKNWKLGLLLTAIIFGFAIFLFTQWLPKYLRNVSELTGEQSQRIKNQLLASEAQDSFQELGAYRLFCVIGELHEEIDFILPGGEQVIASVPCTFKKQDGQLVTIRLIVSLNFDNDRTGIILGLPEITPQLTFLTSNNILKYQQGYQVQTKTLVYFGRVNEKSIGFQSARYVQNTIADFHPERQLGDFAKSGDPSILPNGYLLPIEIGYNID